VPALDPRPVLTMADIRVDIPALDVRRLFGDDYDRIRQRRDALARFRKPWQIRCHHHRCCIFDVDAASGCHLFKIGQWAINAHPHLRQHGFHALRGERHRSRIVTCALQTHDQAKANQLVGALCGHRGEVFDAIGPSRRRGQQSAHQCPTQATSK